MHYANDKVRSTISPLYVDNYAYSVDFCVSYTVYVKTVEWENCSFRGFCLKRESFPIEYFTRLGIHYYKKLLPQKFSHRIFIVALTAKIFPLECFDVYSTYLLTKLMKVST